MEKLRISDNGRYLVSGDGKPFVWLADTVWTMPQRLKWDDADFLMKKRKSQGFTVLQMVALDPEQDVDMHSPAGVPALIDGDLSKPNEEYFKYLDWLLDKAESYGFYVLLLPAWGQLIVGDNWFGMEFEHTVNVDNAYGYGQWIGNRYKDRTNIIWCLGGDRHPIHKGVDYKNVWRNMAEGLAFGVTGKHLKYNEEDQTWKDLMITYHGCHEAGTGECSSMSYWDDGEAWISFIMLQSGHNADVKNYDIVAKEYNREVTMPVWDGEPAYEMMPTSFPDFANFHGSWMVRRRAFWSLFSGSFGHTYGHCSVWCSISEKEKNAMFRLDWYESLFCEGAEQMKYLRDFMESTDIMTCVPRQDIIVKQGEGDTLETHLQACGDSESKTFYVYLPSGGKAELCLKDMAAEDVYLWWYNPKTGDFFADAPCKAALDEGCLAATAPTSGEENDWVLIIKLEETKAPVEKKDYFEIGETSEIKKVFEW